MLKQTAQRALELGKTRTHLGRVATFIPELGKADPDKLGACIYTADGQKICVGDTTTRFSIQSISKIIGLAIALEVYGKDVVFENVGMEPSGDAFNSLLKLENADGTPYNPLINAGAIVISSYLVQMYTFEELLESVRRLCMDPDIVLDIKVCHSEMSNLSRNRAIAYLLESKGVLNANVERTLDYYVKLCSLSVTAESLANFGLILAADGLNPLTGERMLKEETVRIVKTIMLTCGMYDGSGEFAVRVGIPTKSGVGGGLLSVVDGELRFGIYGPALDAKGNSIGGIAMLEYISREMDYHMFGNRKKK
jgi:glutaminase